MNRRPVDLSYEQSLELLKRGDLGRVAVCTPSGPRIFPVNYTVVEDSVVFRTAPYTVLGTYAGGSRLSIEVDEVDRERRVGWSVVATGRGTVVDDRDEIAAIRTSGEPSPWAGGSRLLYLRLHWDELTGRGIGDAAWTSSRSETSRVP
ncbi:MAG TPA: pyridoxamine 5'-phosphate oxidase family protein [Intrasporangium sp.]|nr:pyridoxamine 5'-phosphate oxidase family protein [Intrasporangium sp.]